jgi:hypothetical protein
MKHVSHRGPIILGLPVYLAIICCILFGAWELIHIFVCTKKNLQNYAEIIKNNRAKFNRPGLANPWLCHRSLNKKKYFSSGEVNLAKHGARTKSRLDRPRTVCSGDKL